MSLDHLMQFETRVLGGLGGGEFKDVLVVWVPGSKSTALNSPVAGAIQCLLKQVTGHCEMKQNWVLATEKINTT